MNDFDYHIYDLRSEYPNGLVYQSEVAKQPYFSKTLIIEDEYERTSAIKIGDCCITYTFDKIRRQGLIETTEVIPLWEDFDPYKHQIENIISQTKLSHNKPDKLKVLKLKLLLWTMFISNIQAKDWRMNESNSYNLDIVCT